MLIEMNTIITKTYFIGHGFYTDIIKNITSNYLEAWIYNKNYGIKDHMFSVPAEQQTYEEFKKIVINNLKDYINSYIDDYFNKDKREIYKKINWEKII